MSAEFTIERVDIKQPNLNGKLSARVALEVGGDQVLMRTATLDSDRAVKGYAKEWAANYALDRAAVAARLNEIGLKVGAEVAERQKQAKARPKPNRRVSAVADEFVRSLAPVWHRKATSIFCETIGREIPLTNVWTHASDAVIDAVASTQEAAELSRNDGPPPYKILLGLFKDAARMAATRVVKGLPDRATDREQYIHQMAAVLIKVRQFKADVGETIQDSYYGFACCVKVGGGWHRCYGHPVFARLQAEYQQPSIAIVGDHLILQR